MPSNGKSVLSQGGGGDCKLSDKGFLGGKSNIVWDTLGAFEVILSTWSHDLRIAELYNEGSECSEQEQNTSH